MDQNQQQELMQAQQQLQTIMVQKEELKTKRDEIQQALDELEESGEDEELYKSIGMLLIRRDRDDIVADLEDDRERLDMKIESLERKEEQLTSKLQDAMGDQMPAG